MKRPTLHLSSGLDLRVVSSSPATGLCAGHKAYLKKKKKKNLHLLQEEADFSKVSALVQSQKVKNVSPGIHSCKPAFTGLGQKLTLFI